MEFHAGHARHVDVGNYTGRFLKLGGIEEVTGRRVGSCHIAERLHQAPQGIANELIVVNDRDDRLFAQTTLRHYGNRAQSRVGSQRPVSRLYLELETIQGQLRTTKPWFIGDPWQNDWFYASIVGKLMPRNEVGN
jgi:hypothetical protein